MIGSEGASHWIKLVAASSRTPPDFRSSCPKKPGCWALLSIMATMMLQNYCCQQEPMSMPWTAIPETLFIGHVLETMLKLYACLQRRAQICTRNPGRSESCWRIFFLYIVMYCSLYLKVLCARAWICVRKCIPGLDPFLATLFAKR